MVAQSIMDDKIKYNSFNLRLSEKTKKLLKQKKVASGLSWNLFIYSLLDKNYARKKDII